MTKRQTTGKYKLMRWILSFAGLVVMILIAIFLIVNRDKLSSGGLKELFGSAKSENAHQLQLETAADASFACVGNSLAISFSSGIRLYDKSGDTMISEAAAFSNPAVSASSNWAAAYDIGGKELRVFSPDGKKVSITQDMPITAASLSEGGMALITGEQSYKGAVTVYDNNMSPVYKWYSGTGHITSAAVSPEGKRMAVLTVSASGSQLSSFSLDSEEVKGTFLDPAVFALDLAYISENRIAVLTESSLRIFDTSAELKGEYSFGSMQLIDYSFAGDGYVVLALSNSRWSENVTIVAIGADGSAKREEEKNGEFMSLAARGADIALLFADRVELCSSNLSIDETYSVQGAEKVLLRKDGAAVVIYDYLAEIYS